MSTQTNTDEQNTIKQNLERGRKGGRGDAGYTLLLERMTVNQFNAVLAGDLDPDELRKVLLKKSDEQATLSGWSE
ncbi:hypothetical protein GJR96_00665 [Haloferax sp. MBLA0076]|uniref:Uncharacterized protein n=1 Tax=Haloferax litoreum TaxID=2666140 RepID=A0A6A8GC51_9EURY|nr:MULTISPECIES: hypothetical protein [Haloferax]KAB1192029.1 hypothetical protein Hfx1148_00665 [Haloferax sp. CBA1148]MRX20471.1 hypothetical protein [Haloferax litoreum]